MSPDHSTDGALDLEPASSPTRARVELLLDALIAALAIAALAIEAIFPSPVSAHERAILAGILAAASAVVLAAFWPGPPRGRARRHKPLLAIPATAALAAVGLLVYDHFHRLELAALCLGAASLVLAVARTVMSFVDHDRLLESTRNVALTDGLTGLGNRRALLADLQEAFDGDGQPPQILALFDLDGFKHYNDAFGHPAGDVLLARLGRRFGVALAPHRTYRIGGDEFCALFAASREEAPSLLAAALGSLHAAGEGFVVTSSWGAVVLGIEAGDVTAALQAADQRMYARKDAGRRPADRQARDALLQVLQEREPDLHNHLHGVADSAAAVARRMGLDAPDLDELVRGAELHDIGKMAVPDAILHRRGPLTVEDSKFIRQHTVIGERIVGAAPALTSVARLVRHSHERWDGRGYPDGLAGEAIPLGSRIIAVCDAFDAMTSPRSYSRSKDLEAALAELRRCAGTQFDPRVVDAFEAEVLSRHEIELGGRAGASPGGAGETAGRSAASRGTDGDAG